MATKARNPGHMLFVPTVARVPHLADKEREELIKSLDEADADVATGNYYTLQPDDLQEEFELILRGAHDDELEELIREREEMRRRILI